MRRPDVSVAVPAYNEGARLPPLLAELAALSGPGPAVEILVVDDGSAAEHLAAARRAVEDAGRALAGTAHAIRLVASPANRGKGASIRAGWSAASPDAAWLAFLDADGAVSAREFWRLARMACAPAAAFDVLAGSRILMAGHVIQRRLYRHLQGRVFATLAERALGLGFYDTQCGVKFFRGSMLRPVLPLLREDRWLLDVEAIALLRRRGARCVEEPIDWIDQAQSKVRFGVDAVRMFLGLRRMRRRLAALGTEPALAPRP